CFPIDSLIAILWTWVIAEKTPTATASLPLDRLEHVCQVARIVSRGGHYLRAKNVSLRLIFAAVSKEVDTKRRLRQLTQLWTAENRARDSGNTCQNAHAVSSCGLGRTMTKCDVTDF